MLLKKSEDYFGNIVYSFTALSSNDFISYQRVEVLKLNARAVHERRKEYEKIFSIPLKHLLPKQQAEAFGRRRHKFVRFLAYRGLLEEGGLTPSEIEEAQKGFVPKGYDVHHILPLSLGGTNQMNNLVLIPRELHEKLHQYLFDALYRLLPENRSFISLPEGQKTYVNVPRFPRIIPRNHGIIVERMSKEVLKKELQTVPDTALFISKISSWNWLKLNPWRRQFEYKKSFYPNRVR